MDTVHGEERLTVPAGTFRAIELKRQWNAFNAHNVRSFYASGTGEVREETRWPGDVVPQIETLVGFTPGYALRRHAGSRRRLRGAGRRL